MLLYHILFYIICFISQSGISTTYYHLTIVTFLLASTPYIPLNLKKDTIEFSSSVSYFDILLEVDIDGNLKQNSYDKCDDFNFSKVNFPYLRMNSF